MTAAFAVTVATTSVSTGAERAGRVTYTVTNQTGRVVRARLRAVPLGATRAEWLSIPAPGERDLDVNGTVSVDLQFQATADAPAIAYLARLDVAAEDNPDDDYAQGPVVSFEVAAPVVQKKPFPWWIVAAAATVLVLVIGGIGVAVVLRNNAANTEPGRPLIVPDVTGMQREEARRELETFCGAPQPCFEVRIISILIGGVPPERFVVGRTEPPAGSQLNQGSQIVVNLVVRQ